MKTMIVTGGAGFIGSNFVRYALAQTPWHVVVLDKLTYAGSLLNIREVKNHGRYAFVQGDITDVRLMQREMDRWRPEAVVNFAAETHVDRSIDGPLSFLEANVVGTFGLLEATRQYWSRLDASRREG